VASGRAAEAVMLLERERPGITATAAHGDALAQEAVQAAVQQALDGVVPANAIVLERRHSSVDAKLSTNSERARSILGIRSRYWQHWVAHHLIPFGVVASLPRAVQQAIANSGWMMDSAENLIALPGNSTIYFASPNRTRLPYQSGAHPIYDQQVMAALVSALNNASAMIGSVLRAHLLQIEQRFHNNLFTNRNLRYYHPRLS
jgi:hypothetical protein